LICSGATPFHPLAYRLEHYPHWNTKPPVEMATGELAYPDWFEGTWQARTTLVDAVAPLAPDVVTPGFDSNQDYLNQPVSFQARFIRQSSVSESSPNRFFAQWIGRSPQQSSQHDPIIVADRAFNGLNLMRATLNQSTDGMGDRLVKTVTVDPDNPNQQVTHLEGDRQLVSTVTGRLTESTRLHQFITTEVFQQIFFGISQPYLNEVETTTEYCYLPDETLPITADQVTAIYLSPKDPDYFKAGDRPVALYRYRLELSPET
ncbi:MAG: DUF6816 family protein, partial [Cyanobacteria bacterium P01_E01_bin.6]